MNPVKKLWNRNFLILWQGQFISDFGNAIFSVALSFWILSLTKSAAMPEGDKAAMGLVLAFFAIPRVLLGPVAGALADRVSRKWTIVAADAARALLFAGIGAAALLRAFPFWAVYPFAVIAGACDAFFGPAISSAIPDIVPHDDLSKANSARSVSMTLNGLVGQPLGGVLYALVGAPLMIVINGVSFLYAAVTQLFMKIPHIKPEGGRKHILRETMDGIRYTFGHKGLRALIAMCMATNFFALIGITLLVPLFDATPGFGPTKYGYVMGAMMAGAVLGMLALSALKIRPHRRFAIFGAAILLQVAMVVPIGLLFNVVWMYPLAFVAGICNAVINMMIQTIVQATTPSESRGRVFGVLGTMSGALMPLAMAASGLIAQLAGVRPTIVASFAALLPATLPLLVNRHFKEFINTDIASAAAPALEPAAARPAEAAAVASASEPVVSAGEEA